MLEPVTDVVRAVTEAEIRFFREHGWVKLERLIQPAIATQMREIAAQRLASASGTTWTDDAGGRVRDHGIWTEWRYPARDAKQEPFHTVSFAPALAENCRQLLGRQIPIRYWNDTVTCKVPVGAAGGSGPTTFHQDFPSHSYDRAGSLSFWIALDEVSPEQGAMRFVSGSNREGPLGRSTKETPDQLREYPDLLQRHTLSPPITLNAGDATCHDDLTVHGAPANTTSKRRWSYIIVTLPGDALYTGAAYGGTDGLGLTVGKPFDHPLFPVIG